jgi:hypothetical protein
MQELSSVDALMDWFPYDDSNLEMAVFRGLNKDLGWTENDPKTGEAKPTTSDAVDTNGEGTKLFNKLNSGLRYRSALSKVHVIKVDGVPGNDANLKSHLSNAIPMSFSELCEYDVKSPAFEYYADDFLYLNKLGYPLNHMITLRRFPYPCIDNIFDPLVQQEQDVTRMVAYFDQNVNKLDDILSFSYGLRWKPLVAEMEQMNMAGDQEGLSGFMKKIAAFNNDTTLIQNRLRGPNGNQIDPKHDSNRIYGPVDSIMETHIRDVGLNFEKDFEITFEYNIRSWGGRTPEFVMKDILANILLCTFNDGDFWPGSRYWAGVQPSKLMENFKFMNQMKAGDTMQDLYEKFKGAITSSFGGKGSALQTLKNIIQGGIGMAMATILNKLGRPGIAYTNSLLSGSPVGLWHLTIGHPLNPILTIGDLICDGVDINFPEDSLSYGDFPTKLIAKVKLKPSKPRDRAGIEMMFNHGQNRIYFNEANPQVTKTKSATSPLRTMDSNNNPDSIKEGIVENTKYLFEEATKKGSAIKMKVTEGVKSSIPKTASYTSTGSSHINDSSIQERNDLINQTQIV